MKGSSTLKLIVLGAVMAVMAVGCKKRPSTITNIPTPDSTINRIDHVSGPINGNPPPVDGDRGVPLPNGRGVDETRVNPGDMVPLPESRGSLFNMVPDEEMFAGQTVYFGFDRSAIEPGEAIKVETVASYLNGAPETKLVVDGHCDERGTDGYNLALGERRALAVREILVNLGIARDRIHTRTFGEEMPAVEDHNEEAWDRNRRAEFILLRPPQP